MKKFRCLLLAMIPFAAIAFCNVTSAQDYPSKPMRIVLGFAPGGSVDFTGRLLAGRMSQSMQQPVVVDNKPGASSNIAADLVAKSKPDGYTLLFTPGTHVLSRVFYPNVPFDPIADFEPVGTVVTLRYVVIAHSGVPANNLRELIAYAKANPGRLTYGTPGQGTVNHLAMELLKQLAGIDIVPVHYKAGGLAQTDLLAGHIHLRAVSTADVAPAVSTGKVKALVIAADSRVAELPGILSAAESGQPEFTADNWLAVLAPARMPQPVVGRLNAEIAKAVQDPAMKVQLDKVSVEPFVGPPQMLAALMKRDQAKWTNLIQKVGIKAE